MIASHLRLLAGMTVIALLVRIGPSVQLLDAGQLGEDVALDDPDAATWFRQKAEQGDAIAMNYLGLFYQNGEGVPQDDAEAYLWFNLAVTYATASNILASTKDELVRLRDLSAERLSSAQRADAQRRAREFFESHPPE